MELAVKSEVGQAYSPQEKSLVLERAFKRFEGLAGPGMELCMSLDGVFAEACPVFAVAKQPVERLTLRSPAAVVLQHRR